VSPLLDQIRRHLHEGDETPGSGLDVTGRPDPERLASPLPVEDAAVACVGAALLAAADLAALRTGRRPSPSLDRALVAEAVTSERRFRVDGQETGMGFAPLSRFWPTADGWVRTHANYPWHRRALFGALDVGRDTADDVAAVRSACAALAAEEIERRVVEAGGVAAAVRAVGEWAVHPQGRTLTSEPLVSHDLVGPAPARDPRPGPLPASGVRVLDLTRVIAGPVCTRFLGALGADVLRVDAPSHPDMATGILADTLLGKRSSALDLRRPVDLEALHRLADEADVLVCGYRTGSLDRFGLGPEELADRHPGLVVVYLNAWGHRGPWRERRGFDSVVQAPTGIALLSGDGSGPGALPCQLLDHGTGYLAAAAALEGLTRQAGHGGTHVRRLSLAATAAWLVAAAATAPRPDGARQPEPEGAANGAPFTEWSLADHGPVHAVPPPGALDRVPLRWPGPPARYLEDAPVWQPG
jgi:crotonobetainyl-CoA:carnitine CoA-transferase CaiB-like acyl-CoA transferase